MPSAKAPSVQLERYRDFSPAEDEADQELNLAVARRNSIIDALGPQVDRTVDGANYDLADLVKGLHFEKVRFLRAQPTSRLADDVGRHYAGSSAATLLYGV